MQPLTGTEKETISDALISGFIHEWQLEQLAAVSLDINLAAEIGSGPLRKVAFDLLGYTESRGWTEILLREAVSQRSGNPKLRDIAKRYALAPGPFNSVVGLNAGSDGFEALVLREAGMHSTGAWRKRMLRCELAVCQVLFQDQPIGTGFLVGPDRVMSNWHVFEYPRDSGKLGQLADYTARFDYRATDQQNVASPGTTVPFDAAEGYLDQSHKEELDYVLVQLTQKLGDQKLRDNTSRGWLRLASRHFKLNEPALVLQHPSERTLQVAIGPVSGWVPNKQGEIYEHLANTEDGSSGSPCFSSGWDLLALHHRVDPQTGERNRAIAMSAILSRMGSVGTITLLPSVV
jgi:V8-like Glu-specific endopeptidase